MREEPLTTLIQRVQKGDTEVFGQIVERFQDMACASAYAIIETERISRKHCLTA